MIILYSLFLLHQHGIKARDGIQREKPRRRELDERWMGEEREKGREVTR